MDSRAKTFVWKKTGSSSVISGAAAQKVGEEEHCGALGTSYLLLAESVALEKPHPPTGCSYTGISREEGQTPGHSVRSPKLSRNIWPRGNARTIRSMKDASAFHHLTSQKEVEMALSKEENGGFGLR